MEAGKANSESERVLASYMLAEYASFTFNLNDGVLIHDRAAFDEPSEDLGVTPAFVNLCP